MEHSRKVYFGILLVAFLYSMSKFVTKELQCNLPWILTQDQIGLQECQTEEDLKSYRNLSFRITSPILKQKLVNKGCFRPNCKQTTWTKNQFTNYWDTQDGSTFVAFIIPSTAKVIQRKEIRLADLATSIADCGSYLGLFLGASALSLIDILIVYIKRIFKAIYESICNPKKLWMFAHLFTYSHCLKIT